MKISGVCLTTSFLWLFAAAPAPAQTPAEPHSVRAVEQQRATSANLPGPQHLQDYVAEGKLRLGLEDAILLTLENNTNIAINQSSVQTAKFAVARAHGPFDPVANSSFSDTRATSPSSSQLQGAPVVSSLNQVTQFGYSQTFETGTNFQTSFNATKLSTNSSFNLLNPSISTALNFSIAQPLLRGFGLFPNRAPIVVAQRSLEQSRASFAALVNDAILQAVGQYWNVVQARENLQVQQKSLEEADATYKQNKRALELGALPPLDIYRSESEVASRRVSVIQAEYSLKQAEDQLRLIIGADLDPYFRALDLELTEKPEPAGELLTMDAATALERALARRPEFEALRQQLANDDTSIRLAHNNLLPNLLLTGNYSSSGLNTLGGLDSSLNQTFGFGFPTYGFGVTLTFPIKNRAAQADLGTARVSRRRNLYAERQLREVVTLDVSNSVHQLEQAKLSIAAAKIARDLAQKNLEAEQRKYELGTETIFFVLDAQTRLAQAELGLLQAHVGYQLAVTAVDHATGALVARYHIKIDELTR